MSANYERISRSRGQLEMLIGRIPGYKGYKEKEMRREADRLLREALTRDLTLQLDRITRAQADALDAFGLEWMSEFAALKTSLQTLIDRVRHAPQGYAGFFDAVRVKEEALDALEAFDYQLVERLPAIAAAVESLSAATDAPALQQALRAARDVVQQASDLFAQRSKVIMGV